MEAILQIGSFSVKKYEHHTVVVGSGAAALSCVERLQHNHVKDIALVTEGLKAGTSRNAGSDKQTYYKMSLAGHESDSIFEVANTLYAGGAMDGDIALVEAALSTQCFYRLCELGVEFPTNRYGEYIGYKTDHDPKSRGTSAGPLTSRRIYDVLLDNINTADIRMYDGFKAIKLIVLSGGQKGVLCLDVDLICKQSMRFHLVVAENIIFATGGPANIYGKSVFPESQTGASGVLFAAGVRGKNLTEWQFGMASLKPRWNVSGSFMQVLPCFISTHADGYSDAREFLFDYFDSLRSLLNLTFMKGYQWPFDVRKLEGSSIIDLLVYKEIEIKGRRVFLDFRNNPGSESIDFSTLSDETTAYLSQSGACFGTPVQRLRKLNEPAYQFYYDRGIDLEKERLEIAVCAQHNNGGVEVSCWWESTIPGIFACGEVAGTHGVYRPGGSALNSGQVGAQRIATYISHNQDERRAVPVPDGAFTEEIKPILEIASSILSETENNVRAFQQKFSLLMSKFAGPVRNVDAMQQLLRQVEEFISHFSERVRTNPENLGRAFTLYETLQTQRFYLHSYIDYAINKRNSRGSSLYYQSEGTLPYTYLEDEFRCIIHNGSETQTQLIGIENGTIKCKWREVRSIPNEPQFFESVWASYRDNNNVY